MSDAFRYFVLSAFWTGIGAVLWAFDLPDFWLGFAFAYFVINIVRYLVACGDSYHA